MEQISKKMTEYVIDTDWSFILVEDDALYCIYLEEKTTNKVALVTKSKKEDIIDLDKHLKTLKLDLENVKQRLSFDTQMDPQTIVSNVADIWKTCKGENEFLANVSYMVLGSMMKAYADIYQTKRSFLTEDEDSTQISAMKGIHKIGEMLTSVEHNNGTVNAAANNRASLS